MIVCVAAMGLMVTTVPSLSAGEHARAPWARSEGRMFQGVLLARWAPDERHLAVEVSRGNNLDIEMVDASCPSCSPHSIVTNFGRNADPSWAPDGRRLVFTHFDLGMVGPALYVVDADGGDRRKIGDLASEPSWSPTRDEIVFWPYQLLMGQSGLF